MNLNSIRIDRSAVTRPIADQLVHEVSRQIRSGLLTPCEKLPTERELAEALHISRGTVKRAYQKLKEIGAIEIRRGSGSYVLANGQIFEDNQKKEAVELIADTFARLTASGMSESEILSLINLHAATKNSLRRISIMVISNNHDILSQLEAQLSYLTENSLFSFTVSYFTLGNIECAMKSNPAARASFQKYDLILSSIIDYDRICELLPDCRNRIIKAHISPRSRTLAALSALPKSARISVIYQTRVFLNEMVNTLLSMGFSEDNLFPVRDRDYNPAHLSDGGIDVVLNFNESPIYVNPAFQERVEEFRKEGGTILQFEYRLSRDSLSYIEHCIEALCREISLNGAAHEPA